MMQAQLTGGEWIDLMEGGALGPCEVKWGRNRMRPWLCLNPTAAADPGQREAEEHIEVWGHRCIGKVFLVFPSACTHAP